MLLGSHPDPAQAKNNLHITMINRPSLIIDYPPRFIYLRIQGFSVAIGSEYDILWEQVLLLQ